TGVRANVTIQWSLVEQIHEVGICVAEADATIADTWVHGTAPGQDGAFGDGIVVSSLLGNASGRIERCRIEGSSRAGVAAFGASAWVGASMLECNAIALDGEVNADNAFDFTDGGQNACGCAGKATACKLLT